MLHFQFCEDWCERAKIKENQFTILVSNRLCLQYTIKYKRKARGKLYNNLVMHGDLINKTKKLTLEVGKSPCSSFGTTKSVLTLYYTHLRTVGTRIVF